MDSSPRTTSALPPGGLGGWHGRETPPWSPVTPSHQYRDWSHVSQQGRRGAGPREALEKASTSRSSCVDGALEVWVGRGGSHMGSRAGGAQVLLSSSCLLLLWHLSLSFPVSICPAALRLSWQSSPQPAETPNLEKRSLAQRIHPCQIPGVQGKQRTQHATVPRRKPKKTRQDREKPKLPGQEAANKHLEQMLSDSLQGGAGKGLTTPTKIGVLSAGKPNSLAAGDGEGAGRIWSGDVREKLRGKT